MQNSIIDCISLLMLGLSIRGLLIVYPLVLICIFREENRRWTQFRIPSQSNKVFLITGGNSGLGYHTALHIAKNGGTVILACRNTMKCSEAADSIKEKAVNENIHPMQLDLSALESVRIFAAEVIARFNQIDVLINNAGIMAVPNRTLTIDGFESQMGTNHFGHFLLTSLLFPIIAQNGRIVIHSSSAHFASYNFPWNDIHFEESYHPFMAYAHSKMANLLFTFEINHRLQRSGEKSNPKNISCIAVHPGFTATNILEGKPHYIRELSKLFAMSGEYGALSQVIAACDENVTPSMNNYIGPRYYGWGYPVAQFTSPISANRDMQKNLWEVSETLTNQIFEI